MLESGWVATVQSQILHLLFSVSFATEQQYWDVPKWLDAILVSTKFSLTLTGPPQICFDLAIQLPTSDAKNARKEAKLGWTHVGLSVFKKLSSGDYTQFLDCIYNSEYLMEVWDLVFGNLHLDATLESCLLELTFQVCLNHTSGTLPLEACIVQSRL